MDSEAMSSIVSLALERISLTLITTAGKKYVQFLEAGGMP
jgi:hypothetical protein